MGANLMEVERPFDKLSFELGRLHVHIESIKGEVCAVAEIVILKEHLELLASNVEEADLFWIASVRGETHTALFIFKHKHLFQVIHRYLGIEEDVKVNRMWLEGKLFGHSEESIAAFIKEHYNDQESIR